MKNYVVRQYQQSDYDAWNAFVDQAKNATFLFHRDFMEYHQDRFEDFSLLIFDKNKLVAILPANRVGDTVYSHQGLTYGGLVYDKKMKIGEVDEIFDQLLVYLKTNAFINLFWNPIPVFYIPNGNSAIDFFIVKNQGHLYRKEMNLVVNLREEILISKSKLKHFRKIENLNLEVVEEASFSAFWIHVLEKRLLEKHNVKPIHSLAEISYLKEKFPNSIKQFSVYFENEIIAGITLFESENGVKSQYGATTLIGEKYRALDYLFIKLIEKYKKEGKHFFDMGIVNENNEKGYNSGLLQQKQELGCSVYNQDFYKIVLS